MSKLFPSLRAIRHPAIGVIRLLRLSNSIPAALLVLTGARLARGWPFHQDVWLAALAMWCVTGFGYLSNDLYDICEDRINKPDRPLPAKLISVHSATRLAYALAMASLVVSLAIGWAPFTVAAFVLLLLLIYNGTLKSTAGSGNLLIALLAGNTLLTGAVAAQGFHWSAILPILPAAMTLAAFVASREVLKTLEDIAGDQQANKQTVALFLGIQATKNLVTTLALLTIFSGIIAYFLMSYSIQFLLLTGIGVAGPLLFTVATLQKSQGVEHVSLCLALLKGSYFMGIAALWLA